MTLNFLPTPCRKVVIRKAHNLEIDRSKLSRAYTKQNSYSGYYVLFFTQGFDFLILHLSLI